MVLRRLAASVAVAVAVAVSLLVAVTTPAAAHEDLVSAEPAPDSTVDRPTEVVLRFSAEVVPAADGLVVVGTDGERADDGQITRPDPTTLVVGLRPDLPPGRYAVEWRVLAPDGDTQEGSHVFTVAGQATTSTEATTTTSEASTSTETAIDVIVDDDGGNDGGTGAGPLIIAGLVVLAAVVAGLVVRSRRGST